MTHRISKFLVYCLRHLDGAMYWGVKKLWALERRLGAKCEIELLADTLPEGDHDPSVVQHLQPGDLKDHVKITDLVGYKEAVGCDLPPEFLEFMSNASRIDKPVILKHDDGTVIEINKQKSREDFEELLTIQRDSRIEDKKKFTYAYTKPHIDERRILQASK